MIRPICWVLIAYVSIMTGQIAHGIPLEPTAPVKGDAITQFLPIITVGDPLEAPVAFIRKGNWPLARKLLDALVSQTPERSEVWEVDGFLKLVEDDTDGAESSLRKAITLNPESSSALSKLGHVKLIQNRGEEATRLFEKAIAIHSGDQLANLYLARMALRSGDLNAAIRYYETVVSGMPGATNFAHEELAGLYNQVGRYDATIKLLTPLTTPDVSRATVSILLANAYLEQGDNGAARQQLSIAKQQNSDHPRLAVMEAILDRQEGNLELSARKLREILRLDPNDGFVRYELGRTLLQTGDWRGAITEFEAGAVHLADPYRVRLQIAEIQLRKGDAGQAVAHIEQLLKTRSTPLALYLLADGYWLIGDVNSSLRTADTLMKQHPDYLPGYLIAIRLNNQAGKFDRALATAREATRVFPQSSQAWLAHSGLYLTGGRYDSAQTVIDEALRYHPGNAELRFQQASTYQQLGKVAAAEQLYRELLQDDKNNAVIVNNLSNLLAEDPTRRAEALNFARNAHKLAPDSAAMQDTLGWALHLNGEHRQAVTWLRSALEKAPADGNVLCRLGIVYSSLHRTDQARDAIERCLTMRPEIKVGEQARAVLNAL